MKLLSGSLLLLLGLVVAGGAWAWSRRDVPPAERLRRGQEALVRGDWDAADDQVTRLEEAGHADHAHLLRGQTYLRRGDMTRAVLEYNALGRDNADLLVEASLIYGLGFYSLGRLVEAERFLIYVAAERPDHIDARRALGALYYDRGAMKQAIPHLEKWAELAEGDGQPHRFLSVIFEGMAADEPAIKHYRLALSRELRPKEREGAVAELADLLVRRREYADALAVLDGYKPAGAATADLLALRGECLFGLGRLPEAVEALTQALKANPSSARALRARAQVHLAQEEAEPAARLLETALRADEHDFASGHLLAQALEALGRRPEAAEWRRRVERTMELVKQMSELNREAVERPKDAAVRRRLAEACAKLNKFQLAKMWQRAADACPPPLELTDP